MKDESRHTLWVTGTAMLAGIGLLALVAGCSTARPETLENPIVIGGVATLSATECGAFAVRDPQGAGITLRVLRGIEPSISACRQAIEAVLSPTPVPVP